MGPPGMGPPGVGGMPMMGVAPAIGGLGPGMGFAPPGMGFAPLGMGMGMGRAPAMGRAAAGVGGAAGPPLPAGVPPPPGVEQAPAAGDGDVAFSEFMSAFRSEMSDARAQGDRLQKFVPSSKLALERQAQIEQRANDVFGVGVDEDPAAIAEESIQGAEEFDEWPDEFLLLGVAEQDGGRGGSTSPSPESELSSSTEETASTQETEDDGDDDESDMDDDDDAWPIEMLIN
jgi:hypothetical protein